MDIITAIGFLAGLSIILAVVLAVANRKLKVVEDPRIDQVEEMLPGANCGACGQPGCRAFSEKVVGLEAPPSLCSVGGPDTAGTIAGFLGIDAGQSEKKVARLLCAGGDDVAIQIGEYDGYSSCRAAATIAGGFKGCTFGCLGLADCEDVCNFDAITMATNGLPVVDYEACTACGDCVRICPKGLFEILPLTQHLVVQCKTILKGDAATTLCKVACTGCGICASDAEDELITMKQNLPVIDREKIHLQSEAATLRCPTGAITWIKNQQFEDLFGRSLPEATQKTMDRAI